MNRTYDKDDLELDSSHAVDDNNEIFHLEQSTTPKSAAAAAAAAVNISLFSLKTNLNRSQNNVSLSDYFIENELIPDELLDDFIENTPKTAASRNGQFSSVNINWLSSSPIIHKVTSNIKPNTDQSSSNSNNTNETSDSGSNKTVTNSNEIDEARSLLIAQLLSELAEKISIQIQREKEKEDKLNDADSNQTTAINTHG